MNKQPGDIIVNNGEGRINLSELHRVLMSVVATLPAAYESESRLLYRLEKCADSAVAKSVYKPPSIGGIIQDSQTPK